MLFDVDGVLTDGTIWLQPAPPGGAQAGNSSSGIEVKGFHAHDGIGFSLARLGGLKVGWITKRTSQTVALRARDLRLDFIYQGQANKLSALEEICEREGIDASEVCYVGDDIVDLPVMERVGLAIATANARTIVKDAAQFTTEHEGGAGAGRDAIEYVLGAQGKLSAVIGRYLDEHAQA